MNTIAWTSIGVALLVAEMMTGTFILLFFGAAALIVALARLIGLDNTTIEVILFGTVGMLMLLTMRKKLQASLASPNSYKPDETLTITAPLSARAEGKVDYQGTPWTVVNDSDEAITVGTRVRIVRTEGVRLVVRPLNNKVEQ